MESYLGLRSHRGFNGLPKGKWGVLKGLSGLTIFPFYLRAIPYETTPKQDSKKTENIK
jgi:hypothetical protein